MGKLLGSSPAGPINFDSPAALALNLGSLSTLEGGVGMGISMSGMSALGLGGSSIGRASDEERRRQLENLIDIVGTRPGRVSAEGVERIARKYGFEVQPDDDRVVPGGIDKALDIAAKSVLLEVDLEKDVASRVGLTFTSSSDAATKFAESAAETLQRNLTPPKGTAPINHTLDKFAANLERLARLDKLSAAEVNCFEAISGVYTSLKKIFDHEKNGALSTLGVANTTTAARAEQEVLCKKSGRPQMNAGDSVGLALEYWTDRRHVSTPLPGHHDPESDQSSHLYSLKIDCEASAAEMYPPLRVSDAWVSDAIDKQAEDPSLDENMMIDWQDPPATYVPSTQGQADAMTQLTEGAVGRLPNVRFVARLSPPLVLPLNTAMHLLNSVHVTLANDAIRATRFEGLLFDAKEEEAAVDTAARHQQAIDTGSREIRNERKIVVFGKDEQEREHYDSLFVPKAEFARVLEEIPFDHPRQLVQMLPVLRQCAALSSLLRRSFSAEKTKVGLHQSKGVNGINSSGLDPMYLDVSLTSTLPPPHLTIVIPRDTGPRAPPAEDKMQNNALSLDDLLSSSTTIDDHDPRPISVAVEIGPNGHIIVIDHNVGVSAGEADGEGVDARTTAKRKIAQRLARALDICGDLDLWAEWVVKQDWTAMSKV